MIILFSGTGNTQRVATLLAQHLDERIVSVDEATACIVEHERRIIWCFPIYAWGVPQPVRECMASIRIESNPAHYMICTCGDDIGRADRQWRRLARSRGWNAAGAYSVVMPNTYVNLPGFDVDKPEVAARKLDEMPGRVAHIARLISSESQISDVMPGALPWLKTAAFYPFFMRFLVGTKLFRAGNECVGCGLCAHRCPASMISMENGRPLWHKGKCYMCMRCYHHCPVGAIQYGCYTRGKGQYRINEDQ